MSRRRHRAGPCCGLLEQAEERCGNMHMSIYAGDILQGRPCRMDPAGGAEPWAAAPTSISLKSWGSETPIFGRRGVPASTTCF